MSELGLPLSSNPRIRISPVRGARSTRALSTSSVGSRRINFSAILLELLSSTKLHLRTIDADARSTEYASIIRYNYLGKPLFNSADMDATAAMRGIQAYFPFLPSGATSVEPHELVVEQKTPLRKRNKARRCDFSLFKGACFPGEAACFFGHPRRFGSIQGTGATR